MGCEHLHSVIRTLKLLLCWVSPMASVHPASCSEFTCQCAMISNIQKPTVLRFWCFLWDRRWTAINTEELSTVSSPVSLRWTSAMVSSLLSSHFMPHITRFTHIARLQIVGHTCLASLSLVRCVCRCWRFLHCDLRLAAAWLIWRRTAGQRRATLRRQVHTHTSFTSHLFGTAFTWNRRVCWI